MRMGSGRWTMAMTMPRLTVKETASIRRKIEKAFAKYPDKKVRKS